LNAYIIALRKRSAKQRPDVISLEGREGARARGLEGSRRRERDPLTASSTPSTSSRSRVNSRACKLAGRDTTGRLMRLSSPGLIASAQRSFVPPNICVAAKVSILRGVRRLGSPAIFLAGRALRLILPTPAAIRPPRSSPRLRLIVRRDLSPGTLGRRRVDSVSGGAEFAS
jgi:hypothetical protein